MDNKKDIISYKTNKKALQGKEYSLLNSNKGTNTEQDNSSGFNKKDTENFSVFLNKKTEKLTTALYMVTSFLSDNEPLKWRLRERAVDLLSGISDVRNNNISEVENIYADYSFAIEEIISLLEVAVVSKLISEMNFSILKKEYASLKQLIDSDEYAESKKGRFVFTQDFFQKDRAVDYKTNNLEHSVGVKLSKSNRNENPKEIAKGQTRNTDDLTDTPPVKKTIATVVKARTFKDIKKGKSNRRELILRLFKKNKELTIKDISREVSGCSEKTIQRELITLVSSNVLNKKGERRWSRYSLK